MTQSRTNSMLFFFVALALLTAMGPAAAIGQDLTVDATGVQEIDAGMTVVVAADELKGADVIDSEHLPPSPLIPFCLPTAGGALLNDGVAAPLRPRR